MSRTTRSINPDYGNLVDKLVRLRETGNQAGYSAMLMGLRQALGASEIDLVPDAGGHRISVDGQTMTSKHPKYQAMLEYSRRPGQVEPILRPTPERPTVRMPLAAPLEVIHRRSTSPKRRRTRFLP